jgi:hypothetical protein
MGVENLYVTHNASSEAVNVTKGVLFTGGIVKAIPFSFEVAAADSDGSVYRIGQIPVNARILNVQYFNDAIAGATDYEIGVYRPLEVGGAVAELDIVLGSTDINAGSAVLVNVPTLVANMGKKLWQVVGASAQPTYQVYDLAITGNTVGTAAGTIGGIVWYVED